MRPTSFMYRAAIGIVIGTAAFGSVSCGDVARTGRAPAFIIIENIQAARGNAPDRFFSFLLSDVQTLVDVTINGQTVRQPTFFNDPGRASFRLGLKNLGSPTSPLGPTTLNEITIYRYHVAFRRADGRNVQGVDVPYAFDGGMTVTIPRDGTAVHGFDLVRHQAKLEPPLRNLVGLGGAVLLSTIAEITFYGRDQAGNEVQATGTISVQFGDLADET